MRTTTGTSPFEYTVHYPNEISFSQGRHAYIRLETDNTAPKARIVLSIEDDSHTVVAEIVRVLDKKGAVVFPLSDVFEGFISTTSNSYVANYKFKFTRNASHGNIEGFDEDFGYGEFKFIMSGYSDREIDYIESAATPPTNPYPYPSRIVIYPNLNREVSLFIPGISTTVITSIHRGEKIIAYVNDTNERQAPPFYIFNPCTVAGWQPDIWTSCDKTLVVQQYRMPITVPGGPTISNNKTIFYVAFEVDECMNGVFLEWKDKHGLTHIYRWTLESKTEEIDDSESYTTLDEVLQPVERQIKTIAKKYKLHSRRVDQGIFDLCKSIIGNKELRMRDPKSGEWVPCTLKDAKAEDRGEVLKDLVVTVVKNEYL